MLEQLIQQTLMQLGASMASQVAADPAKAIQGLTALMDSLCLHHTAEDVAQDALDAYEGGHLSAAAAMQIVGIVLTDKEARRASTQPPRRPAMSVPAPQPVTDPLAQLLRNLL